MVADDCLKIRCEAILKGNSETLNQKGDSVKIFSAVRVMGFSTCLRMKISPWKFSSGRVITRLLPVVGREEKIEKDILVFCFSCLFAGLDCLCDLDDVSEELIRTCSIITALFMNLAALRGTSNEVSHQTIGFLARRCLPLFGPTLLKCFQRIACGREVSPQNGILLHSLLMMLRGMLSFRGIFSQSESVHLRQNEHRLSQSRRECKDDFCESEEIWGSLDDSALASIDLDGIDSSTNFEREPVELFAWRMVWNCLTSSIEMVKVSSHHLLSADTEKICV